MLVLNRVKARAQIERNAKVLCEDDGSTGFAGWVPLMSSARPQSGVLSLDTEIGLNGPSLRLDTENYLDDGANNWCSATAIKRLGRGVGMTGVRVQFAFAYGALYGGVGEHALAPRMIQFGVDTATNDGARRYFSTRYNLGASGSVVQKFQALNTDQSTYTDIPGPTYPLELGVNENKRNIHWVELDLDLTNAKYRGFKINGDGYGSLAATPDTTISTGIASPQAQTLTDFGGGLNLVFAIRNRNDTQNTRCWANLAYCRAVWS